MGILEQHALDMSAVLIESYEIADMIQSSYEVDHYLYCKQQVEANEQIQACVRNFAKRKETFVECERFGHFHPDYHEALQAVNEAEEQLQQFEEVVRFKEAEEALDQLLYDVSETIAKAVSPSIKVPSNQLLPASGCSSGNCSGKCT